MDRIKKYYSAIRVERNNLITRPYAESGVDVDGPRIAISDEAEVVGAAGRRDPAVFHARAQVELEVQPELAHFTPATVTFSVLNLSIIIHK